jgi:hypothetical protein
MARNKKEQLKPFQLTERGHIHDGLNAVEWFARSMYNDTLDTFCLAIAEQLRRADMKAHYLHLEATRRDEQ